MLIDAIVPAHNEQATVASVVVPLLASGRFRVLVVDDGSTDATAEQARAAGAQVLSLKPNRGKGQAMLAGVAQVKSDPVAFFDADLTGFGPEHAAGLAAGADAGWDMVCGLRDYGAMRNTLQLGGPLITGERVVRRWVLDKMPKDCWDGYLIETAMNHTCTRHGGNVLVVFMRGVNIRTKLDKGGVLKGLVGQFRMFRDIDKAEQALEDCGVCSHTCTK